MVTCKSHKHRQNLMLDKKEHNYEKAILVGVITQNQDEDKLTEYMDE